MEELTRRKYADPIDGILREFQSILCLDLSV
jgi:hypothetical protein